MVFGPLGLSLAPYVRSSRTLSKWLKPIASWYANLAGYRKMGLLYDDLRASPIPHQTPRPRHSLFCCASASSTKCSFPSLLIFFCMQSSRSVQMLKGCAGLSLSASGSADYIERFVRIGIDSLDAT